MRLGFLIIALCALFLLVHPAFATWGEQNLDGDNWAELTISGSQAHTPAGEHDSVWTLPVKYTDKNGNEQSSVFADQICFCIGKAGNDAVAVNRLTLYDKDNGGTAGTGLMKDVGGWYNWDSEGHDGKCPHQEGRGWWWCSAVQKPLSGNTIQLHAGNNFGGGDWIQVAMHYPCTTPLAKTGTFGPECTAPRQECSQLITDEDFDALKGCADPDCFSTQTCAQSYRVECGPISNKQYHVYSKIQYVQENVYERLPQVTDGLTDFKCTQPLPSLNQPDLFKEIDTFNSLNQVIKLQLYVDAKADYKGNQGDANTVKGTIDFHPYFVMRVTARAGPNGDGDWTEKQHVWPNNGVDLDNGYAKVNTWPINHGYNPESSKIPVEFQLKKGWNKIELWGYRGPDATGNDAFTSQLWLKLDNNNLNTYFNTITSDISTTETDNNGVTDKTQCNDGKDNDGKLGTDMEDPNCSGTPEANYANGVCAKSATDGGFAGQFLKTILDQTGQPSATTGADGCCGDDSNMGTPDEICTGTYTGGCDSATCDASFCTVVGSCTKKDDGTGPLPCDSITDSDACTAANCAWKYMNFGTLIHAPFATDTDVKSALETGLLPPGPGEWTCTNKNPPAEKSCDQIASQYCQNAGCKPVVSTCVPKGTDCAILNKEQCKNYLTKGCEVTQKIVGLFTQDYAWLAPVPSGNPPKGKYLLCLNEKVSGTPTWKWWQASENAFKPHNVPEVNPITQFISNNDEWYYCAAADPNLVINNQANKKVEFERLPLSSYTIKQDINYQYWPDRDCNGVPDVNQYDPQKSQCHEFHPSDQTCYSCTLDQLRGGQCYGPISYCDYFIKFPSFAHNGPGYPGYPGCTEGSSPLIKDAYCGMGQTNLPPVQCGSASLNDVYKEDWKLPAQIPCHQEIDTDCMQGKDTDLDGRVGCKDPDCVALGKDPSQVWSHEHCTSPVEICNDAQQLDEDNNNLKNCRDPACNKDPSCINIPPQSVMASPSEHVMCIKQKNSNEFVECCPTGSHCLRSLVVQLPPVVFATGTSIDTVSSWDVLEGPTDDVVMRDKIRVFNPTSNPNDPTLPIPIPSYIPIKKIKSIQFNILFLTPQQHIKLHYTTGADDGPFDLAQFLTNGPYSNVWHKAVIPQSFFDPERTLDKIVFVENSIVSIDNVFFEPEIDSGYSGSGSSDPKICSSTGQWINSLNQDEGACNAQNPQGYGGFGWTGGTPESGGKCCGATSTHGNYDFFTGAEKGCFEGNIIPNKGVVGDVLSTGLLPEDDGEYNNYQDIIFSAKDGAGQFYVCNETIRGAPPADFHFIYDSITINHGSDAGALIPHANYLGLCAKDPTENYYCNSTGMWEDRAQENKMFKLDGKDYRCEDGTLKEVHYSYDWNVQSQGECNAGKCFCPPEQSQIGSEQLPEGVAGITECGKLWDSDHKNMDRQFCVASGTTVDSESTGSHYCNAGNWTTRTAIVAAYLYSQVPAGNDFILSCNDPSLNLYEPYLGNSISAISAADLKKYVHSACVLKTKDSSGNDFVMIGLAAKLTSVRDDFIGISGTDGKPGAFNKGLQERGSRLDVNYNKKALEWNNNWNGISAITADDDLNRAYWITEPQLMIVKIAQKSGFPSHVSDPSNVAQFKTNTTFFNALQGIYDTSGGRLFKILYTWFKGKAKEEDPQHLIAFSDKMNRFYAAKKGTKEVVASVESSYSANANGPVDYLAVQFYGMNDCMDDIKKEFSTIGEVSAAVADPPTNPPSFMLYGPAAGMRDMVPIDNPLGKITRIRLDKACVQGSSPIMMKEKGNGGSSPPSP